MIEGSVSSSATEAFLELEFVVAGGRVFIDAVVDTGYTGMLVLPETILEECGAIPVGLQPVALADGSREEWPRFDVLIIWHGRHRHFEALASNGDALVGMGLLLGNTVNISVVPNGRVLIEPIL